MNAILSIAMCYVKNSNRNRTLVWVLTHSRSNTHTKGRYTAHAALTVTASTDRSLPTSLTPAQMRYVLVQLTLTAIQLAHASYSHSINHSLPTINREKLDF
jgi:hypothetical protein